MICSMTGFGKGSASAPDGTVFTVEVSSVNRKQLEIRLALPSEFSAWEPEARKKIASVVSRGAVQLRLNAASAMSVLADLDRARLEALLNVCLEYRKKTDGVGKVDIAGLLKLPGVLTSGGRQGNGETLFPVLNEALSQALAAYGQMRETEGSALQKELESRLAGLKKLLSGIEPFAASLSHRAREKILARLEAEKLACDLNDERFLRELLFYADKSDITEEITRLKSHFAQLEKFLTADGEPAGRSMDFLVQEMFREITTLGNKAGTCDISPSVVAFKAELEKMREQIQNVE